MNCDYKVTIITPAYNRAEYLVRLYKSLVRQTDKTFQWLIVDDGSSDNTEQIVNNFKEHGFRLDYVRKQNGGKHTALNYSHKFIKGELSCIVDSDDLLTEDAIESIKTAWNKYSGQKRIGVICFLRGDVNKNPINNHFPDKPIISNHIDFRVNGERNGDCCEVIKSDILKEFPFPEYKGEKFLGESYLWNNAGYKYDTVYINKVIYICDYLEGGLTKSGRKLRLMCPYGGMADCNSYFRTVRKRKVKHKILAKEAILFVCYGKCAGFSRKEIEEHCIRKDLIKRYYLAGVLLYEYWKNKYL